MRDFVFHPAAAGAVRIWGGRLASVFRIIPALALLACTLSVADVSADEIQPITDKQIRRATAICEARFKDAMEVVKDMAIKNHIFKAKNPNNRNEIRVRDQALSEWIHLNSSLFRLYMSLAIRVADAIRTKTEGTENMTGAMVMNTMACPRPQ